MSSIQSRPLSSAWRHFSLIFFVVFFCTIVKRQRHENIYICNSIRRCCRRRCRVCVSLWPLNTVLQRWMHSYMWKDAIYYFCRFLFLFIFWAFVLQTLYHFDGVSSENFVLHPNCLLPRAFGVPISISSFLRLIHKCYVPCCECVVILPQHRSNPHPNITRHNHLPSSSLQSCCFVILFSRLQSFKE